jgi:vacuolar-type H+-ATPase subunit H
MKTAVEWLVEQIIKEKGLVDLDIQAAKEMEKEQIKDAYLNGRYEADKIVMGHSFYAKQYYTETFKQQEQ